MGSHNKDSYIVPFDIIIDPFDIIIVQNYWLTNKNSLYYHTFYIPTMDSSYDD